MFNSNLIKNIILMVCGAFLAIWMGMSLVTDQSQTILKIAATSFIFICLFLGQRTWLLVILMGALNIIIFRGFGTKELGQAAFIGVCLLLFLMRKLKIQFKFGELEFWALLLISCCVQTYMRNPVGLNVLGGGSVGGTPYLIIALTTVTAAILSMLIVDAREFKWALWLSVIGNLVGIPGKILRYGDIGTGNEDGGRIPVLSQLSLILTRIVISFTSPIRACFHPFWGPILLISIAAAAGSGYRNSIANTFIYLAVGIAYRNGFPGLLVSCLGGAFGLVMLALVNLNFPLPGKMQRALSSLPGTWEEQYVKDTENSTEWRVEMWKEALTSERWIRNKILGDGVGMTAEQLSQNQNMDAGSGVARTGLTTQQENMLVSGSYHSGPVHTIRAVGYVGLLILTLTMVRVAVHAHRQIIRCKGTEWYPIALFFCIPQIVHPFFFLFVFGEFQFGIATAFMGIAMIRMLERNLPIPTYVPARLRVPQTVIFNKRQTA